MPSVVLLILKIVSLDSNSINTETSFQEVKTNKYEKKSHTKWDTAKINI